MSTPPLRVFGDDRGAVLSALDVARLPVSRKAPGLVLCHGGDGTLLRAERIWPGVPKLPVRLGWRSRLCPLHRLDAILARLVAGELARTEVPKARLLLGGMAILALNDVVVRNVRPTAAMRFRIEASGAPTEEITGDGLVVATAFGSTGYFRSVTRRSFQHGLGVAFLNTTRPFEPLLLDGDARVEIQIVRGPGQVTWDNDERTPIVREGHSLAVETSAVAAVVVGLDALTCGECRRADGSRFNPH